MTERGYRTPTADDDADVPFWLGALAEDVAADVDDLERDAAEKMGEVGSRLTVAEGLLPSLGTSPEHLAVFRDAERRETWLGIRASDGGPTDWAMWHISSRLGLEALAAPGYLFALTDAQRRMTDLTIRATDGQFEDFVIDRLRARILAGYTPPGAPAAGATARAYADLPYTPGSDLYPVNTDMTRAAGWGSSSMQGIDSRLAVLFGAKGATYTAGGKGSERAEHIAARMGAVPALISVVGGTVPASGSVKVTASNMLTSTALKSYTGTLAGVPGWLLYSADLGGFAFTRIGTGQSVNVPADTPFLPDLATCRDAVNVLWMGKNNTGQTDAVERVIQLTDASFDWLAPLNKRCLVLGHFVNTRMSAGDPIRARIGAINAAHKARYGRGFVDVAEYLTGAQVWRDTGIAPTADDVSEQALGNKPPSLSSDAGHLNAAGYEAVKNLIADRLTELGWYN